MANSERKEVNLGGYNESRRAFVKTFLVGLPIAAAVAVLGWELRDGSFERGSDLTSDQINAERFYQEAAKKGDLIEVEIVNPDDPNGPVKARKNPAILDNFLTKVKPGEKFEGILVKPVPGRQQMNPDLGGPWMAVKLKDKNNQMGFILGILVRRADGEVLTAGREVYDVRPGQADILSPLESSQ